jgi:hypothetical protein
MTTLKATATKLSNSTSYGADMIHYAGLKGEAATGPLYFYLTYPTEQRELAKRFSDARSNEDVVRQVVLEHIQGTPEGEAMLHEYNMLKAIPKKTRTIDQSIRQQALLELQNQLNTQAIRNADTCLGIDLLRSVDREVNIQRIIGTNKYACYVKSSKRNDEGQFVEFLYVPFTATQLRKLVTLPKDSINADMPTAKIRELVDSLKAGTPNNDKGGSGDAIARADIGKTAKALEASLSGTFVDGKLQGVSATTREAVMMLYAMVHREASETERNAALVAYDTLAADADKKGVTLKGATVVDSNKAKLSAAVAAKKDAMDLNKSIVAEAKAKRNKVA